MTGLLRDIARVALLAGTLGSAGAASADPSGTSAADRPIRLMVMREVTTRTAHAGDRFLLHVDQDTVLGEDLPCPAGTPAWGEVVSASASGLAGRSGKLTTRLLYIELGGRRYALRGDAASAGTPGAGTTVAATAGFALLGAGPIGLLARGTNAKLKAGEIVIGHLAAGDGGPQL